MPDHQPNKLVNGPDISDVNIDFYVAETRKLVDELVKVVVTPLF